MSFESAKDNVNFVKVTRHGVVRTTQLFGDVGFSAVSDPDPFRW